MKLYHICIAALIAATFTSCYDLSKSPEGQLSTVNPFSTVGEMSSYLDQFYQSGVRAQGYDWSGGYIASGDLNSDNMSSSSVSTRLNGSLTLSNAAKMSEYTNIRNVNFLINNLGHVANPSAADYKQCVGEAYYFRAWYYFQLFKKYGKITWVSKPLDPTAEEMNLPRQERTVIADSILADLDKAVANLSAQRSSATMRVHQDVARALKSEVALYEGTWEKYHKKQKDEFFTPGITDEKIADYLKQCVEACKAVVDRGVWKIYSTGNTLNDYRVMFQTEDLSSNSEVLWFKRYDGDNIGNSVDRYLNQGGSGTGVAASLVDDYLTIDGKPFVGEQVINAKKTFGDELKPTLRDPRLSQTICMPGQVLRPDQPAYVVPPLTGSGYNKNESGYSLLKFVQIDYKGNLDAEYKGSTPGIQYRYADILLNYAEALAELNGAGNAQLIISLLKPLRDRVGMPAIDFDREYNTSADYPFAKLDKYIQAVRRERRIELACEGRRTDDIMRWAAADELIVGKRAVGAMFVGSNLENNAAYGGKLVYDKASGNNLYLTGKPGDSYRYILPINPSGYENGWAFNVHRDYLLPIQPRMLSLTNGQWTQNPGWE
uniref:RagB/SusD family nutrient uptake outer membrane protein n=2 Tax=unclassified Prevotella TaxID=2638335 RepID=A0AB33JMG9_9BACT